MNYLLSVSAEAEHPNFVNPPKGEFEARQRSGPLLTNGAESELSRPDGKCGPPLQSVVDGVVVRLPDYPRTTAPSGMIPVSRYRQNAINSFRAKATMPILRMRLFPSPNFLSYQRASALLGW